MMKSICLIGNNGFGAPVFDGQRVKVRTYKNILEAEGFDVHFVELEKSFKRLFSILHEIKRGIKQCDIIVLITSDNGERILIPYINRINAKYKKRFVFSQIGTSSLYKCLKNMNEDEKRSFFHEHDFTKFAPSKREIKKFSKIDAILTETTLINDAFSEFYHLKNCHQMTNFRIQTDNPVILKEQSNKLIYLSRVMTRKGIFDLMNVLNNLSKKFDIDFTLDIYGGLNLTIEENTMFYNLINKKIRYCGELDPTQTIDVLKDYDLLCFPTKCEGEGTPGCIVESLIAGTPVLSSNFTQSDELLNNGVDSLIFEFGNLEDMKDKLISFLTKKIDYKALRSGASKTGEKFTYRYNRDKFLKLING